MTYFSQQEAMCKQIEDTIKHFDDPTHDEREAEIARQNMRDRANRARYIEPPVEKIKRFPQMSIFLHLLFSQQVVTKNYPTPIKLGNHNHLKTRRKSRKKISCLA